MVREDLINSAVSFLQDPSVANSPIDKRIAFLQSKNLTQEEIDVSLARAGEPTGAGAAAPSTPAQQPPSNYAYRQQPPPPPPGYGAYPGYWQQPPPPEVPRRDWRDWFIMATVLGGVGYGLYFTAKRYIAPLIAPPTPPLLEQDKASVDAQFDRAFALLDQLETDTKALKSSEENRTQRLDAALAEMETVITSLRDSSRRRDDDSRRIEDDVRGLRDLIPKALETHKENTASQLKDLGSELKSLKTLVANRMGSGPATPSRPIPGSGLYGLHNSTSVNGAAASSVATPATPVPAAPAAPATPAAPVTPAAPAEPATTNGTTDTAAAGSNGVSTPSYSPYNRFTNGRASIPAWQMAASKSNQEETPEKKDTSESGTVAEASSAS